MLFKKYRHNLLQSFLQTTEVEEIFVGSSLWKTITVKDIVYWVTETWDEMSETFLKS